MIEVTEAEEVGRWLHIASRVRDAHHELGVILDVLHAELSDRHDRLLNGDLEQAGVDEHDREVEAAKARHATTLRLVPGA